MPNLAKILTVLGRRPESVQERPHLDSERRATRERWLLIALVAAGLALLAWGIVMSASQGQDGLRRLARGEQHSLYLRTLQEIETTCRQPAATEPGELRDHCIAQARFLVELPECEAACRHAAGVIVPHAHRYPEGGRLAKPRSGSLS